jgi:hypothetical protein
MPISPTIREPLFTGTKKLIIFEVTANVNMIRSYCKANVS